MKPADNTSPLKYRVISFYLCIIVFLVDGKAEIKLPLSQDNGLPVAFHSTTIATKGDVSNNPTVSDRFANNRTRQWTKDNTHINSLPIDLSFLNVGEKPAGKRGFVQAEGESLVFADGSKARFWGTNITARAIFQTSKVNICKQARRLSALGFNLARIHHHDSSWVNPNVFGQKGYTQTKQLDKRSMDSIDWWIKCLKEEGIYTWLDLHVERQLQPDDDIFAFNETLRGKEKKRSSLKGYNYVNETIKNAMKQFNRSYLTHINPYTMLAYKDDPAIIAVLVTNENDVTHHFGNRLLPAKKVPLHTALYMKKAKEFAKSSNLPESKVWRSWEPGASKIFLNDLEYRFNQEMINDLRNIGVKVPIVTTSTWGYNPLSSLPALTAGDMIDVHSYGGTLELEKNPLLSADMTSWMAAGQVADMPMSVSEWNVESFPVEDRHTAPIIVASRASHQGWDAIMQFAHSKDTLDNNGKPSNWNAFNDPALLATLPAAALIYRLQHVREADTTFLLEPGISMFYDEISPKTSKAIRTISKIGKLQIAMPTMPSLPWLEPSPEPGNSIMIDEMDYSPIDPTSKSIASDTGEILHNWVDGVLKINTVKSQIVTGWVGGKQIRLDDVTFNLKTRNATVAVQSLDELPISNTGKILITLASVSMPYEDLKGRLKLPFYSQKLEGELEIKARQGMEAYILANNGNRKKIATTYSNGRYKINLDEIPFTHWVFLSVETDQVN